MSALLENHETKNATMRTRFDKKAKHPHHHATERFCTEHRVSVCERRMVYGGIFQN